MRVKNRELYSVRPQNFKHGRPDYGHLALAYYIALCQGDDTVSRLDCYTTSRKKVIKEGVFISWKKSAFL